MSRLPFIAAAFALLLAGCSTVQVRVRPDHPKARDVSGQIERTVVGQELSPVGTRLQSLLSSAHQAWNARDERRMNAEIAGIVTLLRQTNFEIPSAGPGARWRLGLSTEDALDPRLPQRIIPASDIEIRGLQKRAVQEGIGIPYVFSYAQKSPFFSGQPGIPRTGLCVPATAVLTFRGTTATLRFVNTLSQDTLKVRGRTVPLAADYSAAIALTISRATNRSIDISSLFLTRQRIDRSGLFQFQPYDPHKIPVIFVHGLLSRPEAWTQAANSLLADPEVRRKYQFWFLLYPTGLPVWKTAALLRSGLDRFRVELKPFGKNPGLDEMVIVGHSMGGLVASLVVREGGPHLWRQFSSANAEALQLSQAGRHLLETLIFFPPRRDVGRVIFVATPHRGSQMALHPFVSLISRLIRLPQMIDPADRSQILSALNEDVRGVFRTAPTSLRFLQANSPLLTSIQKLPLTRSIPYHSIIGDRGRGDTPNSSDGVVPYWSSHLPTAKSEKIVPSDHGAQENAEAIQEMARILREHADQ